MRYGIKLVPGGVIPPDLKLTIPMQPVVKLGESTIGSVPAFVTCILPDEMFTGQVANAALAFLPIDHDTEITVFSSDVSVLAFQDPTTHLWTLDTLVIAAPAGSSGFSYTVKAIAPGDCDVSIASPDLPESATCSVTVTCQTVITDVQVVVNELGKVLTQDFNATDDHAQRSYYDDGLGAGVGSDDVAHTLVTVCTQWRVIDLYFILNFATRCPGQTVTIDVHDPRTIDSSQNFDAGSGQNVFAVNLSQPLILTYNATTDQTAVDAGVDLTFTISVDGVPLTIRRAVFTLTL